MGPLASYPANHTPDQIEQTQNVMPALPLMGVASANPHTDILTRYLRTVRPHNDLISDTFTATQLRGLAGRVASHDVELRCALAEPRLTGRALHLGVASQSPTE